MSLDKFKEIINNEYFAVFKEMCSEQKEIASNAKNAKSMDDVISLSKKILDRYSYYQLGTIIALWTKVKASSSFEDITGYLLENHFQGIDSYPSPTTCHLYATLVGSAALSSLGKAVEQSIIAEDLKSKVESGLVENYKKREMHKYAISFEQLSIGQMIPWKKEESKSNSRFLAGTSVAYVPVTVTSAFFKPATDEKSNNTASISAEKLSESRKNSKCIIL